MDLTVTTSTTRVAYESRVNGVARHESPFGYWLKQPVGVRWPWPRFLRFLCPRLATAENYIILTV